MTIMLPPGASKFAARVITPPPGFDWPFGLYPIRVFGSFGRFSTDVDPRSLVNPGIWSTEAFVHVDVANGNDSTAALVSNPQDTSKPAQTIAKAVQLGNASGTPYRIFVKAGAYNRSHGLNSNGTVFPTQHCSVEGWGGRVVTGLWDDLSWSSDATFTSTYSTSRSNALRVFDPSDKDGNGYYHELTLVADAATCNSTPDSWAQVGSTLYVHRADGSAVTNANTRVYLGANLPTFEPSPDDFDIYVSGIDMEGGSRGAFSCTTQATRNIVAEDCTFRYSGSIAAPIDCVQLVSQHGIAAFFRCDASKSTKDGFNAHNYVSNPSGTTHLLTIDCTGRDNGRGASQSNNGITAHEDCRVIDINGVYDGCWGANVHCISDTQTWCVGTLSSNSHGDIPLGGMIGSTGFRVNDNAKMWLDSTLSVGNLVGVTARDGTSTIFKRGHRNSSGIEYSQAGTSVSNY